MAMVMTVQLDNEIKFFEAHRLEWIKEHEGQFALIRDGVVHFFDTDEEAYVAGLELWGEVPMLIKRVQKEDAQDGSLSLMYNLVHAQP